MNNSWITLMRVSCMARGPRARHAKAMGYHPRAYDQSLPHRFAKYFDVYYHRDTYANWMFNCKKDEVIEKEKSSISENMRTFVLCFCSCSQIIIVVRFYSSACPYVLVVSIPTFAV